MSGPLLLPTQLGFLKHRHSTKGIRQAVAATVQAQDPSLPVSMLLRIDAEKAFDSVFW